MAGDRISMGPSQRTNPVLCPNCGYLLDACAPVGPDEDAQPSPGDWSICLNCSSPLIRTEDQSWRQPSKEEIVQLGQEEPETATMLARMGAMAMLARARRPTPPPRKPN